MPTHDAGDEEERRALDVFIKLMRAAEAVGMRTSSAMASRHLTPSQFGVLETLLHLGPLMVSQLAEKRLKSRNNFTIVVDNLEKLGYVHRERDQEDRRAVRVHLTENGEKLIREILPEHIRAVAEDMQVLTAEEQIQLGGLLKKLGQQEIPIETLEMMSGCRGNDEEGCG